MNIVDALMSEVREEIRDGADAQCLAQILRQKFERAYEAGKENPDA